MVKEVKAKHILVSKLSIAEELLGKIKKGESFEKLAEQYSECPSRRRGGSLGWFGRGKMVKPFEAAAFALQKGQVSEIVKTQFGYHLIKLEDSR